MGSELINDNSVMQSTLYLTPDDTVSGENLFLFLYRDE
jgi:hypothetical protein